MAIFATNVKTSMKRFLIFLLAGVTLGSCDSSKQAMEAEPAQQPVNDYSVDKSGYWQQHADYTMEVDMNVENYKYTGNQTLVYTNNSPYTLDKVYYHLYFNAFQPGSQMDVRSRTIKDPDPRVGDRISKLSPEEYGELHVMELKQDGQSLDPMEEETILVVPLAKPIMPGQSTTFTLKFEGQVPKQIRRSGRNNKEGVALSMTQWYPKLAEFDREGWHPNPYIGREFHGVWGDFDVTLHIDKDYLVGGTGYLQNPEEVGYNYEEQGSTINRPSGEKLTWHFKAPMVHDFTWAADPDYVHDKLTAEDGTVLHFIYQDDPEIEENWKKLQSKTEDLLLYFNENIGPYPWDQYSVIQGGDGGMEYAMCTLITGEREFGSLLGVTAHEMAHAWFQHLLATDEAKYEWMDEGFTTFISSNAMDEVTGRESKNPNAGNYRGYIGLAKSGYEQPQTTHADRYNYNAVYGASAYSKGAVFLAQLGYIVGEDVRDQIIKDYYEQWKFKHPTPNDFIRVAEQTSGFELDWYLTDWTETTNVIDYAVEDVSTDNGSTVITLSRKREMPMPLDVHINTTDGEEHMYYIPLEMMRNEKNVPDDWKIKDDWAWAYPTYKLQIDVPKSDIKSVVIDPQNMMADIDRENNVMEIEQE